MTRHALNRLLLGAAIALTGAVAGAQSFPTRVVTMIVPSPAGGASDFAGRLLARDMTTTLKQPVIVENVSGAGGTIGTNKAHAAAADGYTMLLGTPIELILSPLSMAGAKYTPQDFRPVSIGGRTPMVLAVRKDLPARSVDELLALLRRSGEPPLTFASSGQGSLYHLLGERLLQLGGGKGLHVPFAGVAPMVQNLGGGHVDFAFLPLAGPVAGAMEGGLIRALAITSPERSVRQPALPTLRSVKGLEDFVYSVWAGVMVPSRVPEEVALRLQRAADEALKVPEVRKALEDSGAIIAEPSSLADLQAFYQREVAAYRAMARSVNLQPQ